MEKAISGVVLIHAKRGGRVNPSRRENTRTPPKRSYPSRRKQPGEQGGAMKPSDPFGDAQTAIAPSSVAIKLKNTINIDKFPKMFMGRTSHIISYILQGYQGILK